MTTDLHFRRLDKADGLDWNYVTTAPCVYVFGLKHTAIPKEFHHRWFSVDRARDADGGETVVITVAKDYAFDGCSVVPDFPGTVEASLVHDALYQFADDLARAWSWSVWSVLRFADLRFADVMVFYKVPAALRRTYYAGVVVFGWVYNRGAKLVRWLTGN